MKKYLINEVEVTEKEFYEALERNIEEYVEDNLDELIDECNEEVRIGSLVYAPSQVLKRVDPAAYRCYAIDEQNARYEDVKYELEQYGETWYCGDEFKIEEEDE